MASDLSRLRWFDVSRAVWPTGSPAMSLHELERRIQDPYALLASAMCSSVVIVFCGFRVPERLTRRSRQRRESLVEVGVFSPCLTSALPRRKRHPARHLLHLAEEVVTVGVVPYLFVVCSIADSHISAAILAAPRAEARHMVVARKSPGLAATIGGRHPNAEPSVHSQRRGLSGWRLLSVRIHRVLALSYWFSPGVG